MSTIGFGRFLGWLVLTLRVAAVSAAQEQGPDPQGRSARDAWQSVLDRPARLDIQNSPLPESLARLQQTSGVSIVFSPSRLPRAIKVNCPCTTLSVREVLLRVLHGTGFAFREVRGQVIVSQVSEGHGQRLEVGSAGDRGGVAGSPPTELEPKGKADGELPPTPPEARPDAAGAIAGLITGVEDEPLAGARVALIGGGRGTVTGPDGRFLIGGTPAGRHTVRVAYPGYEEGSRVVSLGTGDTVEILLPLESRVVHLTGVVAVGYGTARRRDVTGAIGSVPVTDLHRGTTASVGQMLQGRVAGAQVTQNTGAPGAGVAIRVRGTASISAASEPLYVIDGVPAISAGNTNNSNINPLAAINPNDIASIEVLKDASSTAIYGARGAAGVVLITTRQGQRGEDRLTIESTYGMQAPARYLDVLDGPQFAEMVNEARANAGLSPIYTPAQLTEIRSAGRGTDWQRMLFRNASIQSHTLSFSGGDESTRYLLSGSYYDHQGILVGSDFRRYSGRINVDRFVTQRLQVGTRLTLGILDWNVLPTDEETIATGVVNSALYFNPVVEPRHPDGTWVLQSPVTNPVSNPLATVEENLNHHGTFSALSSSFAEYRLLDGLRVRSSFGLVSAHGRQDSYAPRTSPLGAPHNGQGSANISQTTNLTNENIASFQREIGRGQLDLTGGFTIQTSRTRTTSSGNSQFVNDLTGVDNLGAGTRPTTSSTYGEWTLLSQLARANYNLLDRYLFTFTGRRDGSSRFGKNNKWGFFPSAAFAWRAIDESFMRRQRLFSDLKLRISYGVTGNQEIGLYQALSRLDNVGYSIGGVAVVGFAPGAAAPNPDLKWETTRQYNAGLDFGVLENRLNGSVDVYRSVTDDLLLTVGLPASSGYRSQLRNVGSVRNAGLELALNSFNVETDHFSWRSALTVAHNRNEVTTLGIASELSNSDQKGFGGTGQNVLVTQVGKPLGTFMGKRTRGLYQEGDACPLTVVRPRLDCVPGEYRYVDVNRDGRINANDNVALGNGQPDFYGGLSNSANAGPVQLNVFLQFSYGAEILNAAGIYNRQVNTFSNQTSHALRRWTPANTSTDVPRANADRPREVYDIHVEDGSFVRLQTVSLGYDIPARLMPRAISARVLLTGQNLTLWSDYSGYDPEVNSYGNDATAPGVDAGAYPRARSYSLGVNLSF